VEIVRFLQGLDRGFGSVFYSVRVSSLEDLPGPLDVVNTPLSPVSSFKPHEHFMILRFLLFALPPFPVLCRLASSFG